MINHVNEFVLFFLAIAGFLAVIEVGFRLGRRHGPGSDGGVKEHVQSLQTASLGLLSLLLGFNIAMAASRFDARKALIQEEVNTISNAWLRGQLLPMPQREEVAGLLRDYVATRVDFMRAGTDETKLEMASHQTSGIDEKLWGICRAAVDGNTGGAQVGLFVQSLNEMGNVKWKRRDLLGNHVPEPVIYLLFLVALGALGFMGYGRGLHGRRQHLTTGIYALLIACVYATILDFDRPRGGFIRVSEEGMVRLQKSFAAK